MGNLPSQISRIDQVVITASPGDAITSMAIALRTQLREQVRSDIYALTVLPELEGDVLPIHRLSPDVPTSRLVYHSSFGEPQITSLLEGRRQPISMIFHNLTPYTYFEEHSARFATGLLWGEHELDRLRDRWDLVIADSGFNARFLEDRGYRDVKVLPLGVKVDRLAKRKGHLKLERELRNRFPNGYLVVVAQQLPHKRIELAISTLSLLRHTFRRELGLVVVGPERIPSYSSALQVFAERLRVEGQVHFAGGIDDDSLASILRTSSCLLLTSDHEGLGIPPLEAMSLLVPVIARDVGAVKETLRDGALILPKKSGPCAFAAAVDHLLQHSGARARLLANGLSRINSFRDEDRSADVVDLLLGRTL